MYIEMDDLKNGWFQINLGLKKNEIDPLIAMLEKIKGDPSQHFHLMSDYEGEGGVGDVEIYIQENEEQENIILGGTPIAPNR